jgi:hydrogenase maturation factor
MAGFEMLEVEATVGRKVNLGNYESLEVRASVRRTVQVEKGNRVAAETAIDGVFAVVTSEVDGHCDAIKKRLLTEKDNEAVIDEEAI